VNVVSHDRAAAIRRAAWHMRVYGFEILDLDWESGEYSLDLVAHDPDVDMDMLIVVHVQVPDSGDLSQDIARISAERIAQLRAAPSAWMSERLARYSMVRADVIGFTVDESAEPNLRHMPGSGLR